MLVVVGGRGREGCFAHCVTMLANQNSPSNNITGITANPTRASLINVLANSVLVYMSTCINRLFYFQRDSGSFRLSQTRLFKLTIFGSRSGKSSIWPNIRFLCQFFFILYGAPGDSDLSSGCSWLYRHLRITSKLWALKKNNWLLCVFLIIIAHAVVSV